MKFGSSNTFNRAFTELIFKNSILSINTNLGLLLNEDLLRFKINFLIWFISIDFLSVSISIILKFGLDLLIIVLKVRLLESILKVSVL